MALSMAAPSIRSLNYSKTLASSSSSSTSKLSSLTSSHHFSLQLRPLQFNINTKGISSSSRPRILPLVKASKQSFSNFDELLAKSDKPVLVDFYATWCGPCQFMVPILNEVSTKLQDTIQVVKIDTEKYPSIADKYQIAALPTFIIFKDGEPHDRFEGALTVDQLVQRIESSLKVKQ